MQQKKTIMGIVAAMVLTISALGVASAQSSPNANHDNGQYHNVPQHEQPNHSTYHE